MIVCEKCKKEMKVMLNGVMVVFHYTHVYAGDRYQCPTCGAVIVNANQAPYYVAAADMAKEPDHKVVRMD